MDFHGSLLNAWYKVHRKGGAPGLDQISLEEFGSDLDYNIQVLALELEENQYMPGPVKRVVIDKAGKSREIGILNIRDRIVHQMVAMSLTPLAEQKLLDCCYSYRPGRSAVQAKEKIMGLVNQGFSWVLESDIDKFFDNINHLILMERLQFLFPKFPLISLVEHILHSTSIKDMKVEVNDRGALQGSPLSPVLSNIYLLSFDTAMIARGFEYIRYSDDFIILAQERSSATEALATAYEELQRLGLNLKEEKTVIQEVSKGFNFLGFHFRPHGTAPSIKAIGGLFKKLDKLLQVGGHIDKEELLRQAIPILRGWDEYYDINSICAEIKDIRHYLMILNYAEASSNSELLERLLLQRPPFRNQKLEWYRLLIELLWKGSNKKSAMEEMVNLYKVEEGQAIVQETILSLFGTLDSQILDAIDRGVSKEAFGNNINELTEVFLEIGDYSLAKNMARPNVKVEEKFFEELPDPRKVSNIDHQHQGIPVKVKRRFIELFTGREGIYAVEKIQSDGQRSFCPTEGILSEELVEEHLKGSKTLGVYLQRINNTVKFLVIDIDVSKKEILQAKGTVPSKLRLAAHQYAFKIKEIADREGLPCYVADSGYKGYHCWIFFSAAIPSKLAIGLAEKVLHKAGPQPTNINREVFPNKEKLKNGQLGPLIKLPLGVHSRTGNWCHFFGENMVLLPDQNQFLVNVIPAEINKAREFVYGLEKATVIKLEEEEEFNKSALFYKELSIKYPLSEKVIKNCGVVKYLVDKSINTSYLNHFERLTLLQTLGHLEEEGKLLLHKLISYCLNYNRKITEKYIGKMLPKPLSCPKIREENKELTAQLGCDCRLTVPTKGYPSPVLHGIKSYTGHLASVQPVTADNTKVDQKVNALAIKMINLRKHQRQIEKSLLNVQASLEGIMLELGKDCLEIDMGRLVKVEKEDRTEWIVEL